MPAHLLSGVLYHIASSLLGHLEGELGYVVQVDENVCRGKALELNTCFPSLHIFYERIPQFRNTAPRLGTSTGQARRVFFVAVPIPMYRIRYFVTVSHM